jgi:hypothetical protein
MGVVPASFAPRPARRPRRIVFVIPCGGSKLDAAAPASDLYTSSYFRGTLAAARSEVADEDILVLSAAHGLVTLDTVLAPYDTKMGDAGCVTSEDLALQVPELGLIDAEVYGMLPAAYFDALDGALRFWGSFASPVYEATRGIGEHKHVAKVLADRDADQGPAQGSLFAA